MNDEEKNVMTIVTIARIVESTLWYCLKPRNVGGFTVEERTNRAKALTALTQEGSPFSVNCDNNGEAGKNLKEEMQYFIEDVYGENGRIVYVTIDNKVVVEQSLIIELFSTIVKLRGYLEMFLSAALNALKERGKLESDFEELVNTDVRYYHSFAGKISCMLISNQFLEINQAANTYAQSYSKQHNGVNPNNDPEFDVHKDPTFRMLENEFHQLNQDMVSVLNSYGQNDEEFRFARESVYSDCDIFSGKKQTTDLKAFFAIFTSYFDKILDTTQGKLNRMFNEISQKVKANSSEASTTEKEAETPTEDKGQEVNE